MDIDIAMSVVCGVGERYGYLFYGGCSEAVVLHYSNRELDLCSVGLVCSVVHVYMCCDILSLCCDGSAVVDDVWASNVGEVRLICVILVVWILLIISFMIVCVLWHVRRRRTSDERYRRYG